MFSAYAGRPVGREGPEEGATGGGAAGGSTPDSQLQGLQVHRLGALQRLAPVDVDVPERMACTVATSEDLVGQKVHQEDERHGDDG